MISVRIDKWLWAARFFKTRTLAARACVLGRIHPMGSLPRLHGRSGLETCCE